jgi:hypothetical protein
MTSKSKGVPNPDEVESVTSIRDRIPSSSLSREVAPFLDPEGWRRYYVDTDAFKPSLIWIALDGEHPRSLVTASSGPRFRMKEGF